MVGRVRVDFGENPCFLTQREQALFARLVVSLRGMAR